MSTNRGQWLIMAAVVAVAAAVGLSTMAYAFAHSSSLTGPSQGAYRNEPSYMGGWSYLSESQLGSIATSQPVKSANDTLTFSGNSVRILVLMGPMAEGQNMLGVTRLTSSVNDSTYFRRVL